MKKTSPQYQPKAWIRFHILPLTITVACLLLVTKVLEIRIQLHSLVSDAVAEEPPAEVAKEVPKEEVKKEEHAEEAEEKPPESEDSKEKAEGEHGEEATEGEHGEKAEKEAPPAPPPVDKGIAPQFSKIEIDLLEKLSDRRKELEQWESEVAMKEELLKATEIRLNDKLAEIEALKKEVEVLLAQYQQQDDAKIRSLVKIYENMKPIDAARIFEEVEMPILLEVVDRMSERKVAPILANMTAKKAKNITTELAAQRRIKPPNPAALQ